MTKCSPTLCGRSMQRMGSSLMLRLPPSVMITILVSWDELKEVPCLGERTIKNLNNYGRDV